MLMPDDIALAYVVHVLAVIHWIGGLAFVTLVVLPLARRRDSPHEGLRLFESIERRFAAQVRVSIALAGAAGLWITYRLDLWARFADPRDWWMSAMVGLWLLFALMVYVVEPLAHGRLENWGRRDPAAALRRLARAHVILLALSTLTACGAAAGAHGFALS
jgi:uncharacterized membrane protein